MLNRNYGKLTDGAITYAPTQIKIGNTYYPAPTAEQYLRADDGPFHPVANNQPEYRKGFTPVRKGYEERDGKIVTVWKYEPIRHTEQDFNSALEQHLRSERMARGYDEREPSDYKDSGIHRWRQDALDWIAHRDAVMVYGLNILNKWRLSGIVPDYDTFVSGLPRIVWTIQGEQEMEIGAESDAEEEE